MILHAEEAVFPPSTRPKTYYIVIAILLAAVHAWGRRLKLQLRSQISIPHDMARIRIRQGHKLYAALRTFALPKLAGDSLSCTRSVSEQQSSHSLRNYEIPVCCCAYSETRGRDAGKKLVPRRFFKGGRSEAGCGEFRVHSTASL